MGVVNFMGGFLYKGCSFKGHDSVDVISGHVGT